MALDLLNRMALSVEQLGDCDTHRRSDGREVLVDVEWASESIRDLVLQQDEGRRNAVHALLCSAASDADLWAQRYVSWAAFDSSSSGSRISSLRTIVQQALSTPVFEPGYRAWERGAVQRRYSFEFALASGVDIDGDAYAQMKEDLDSIARANGSIPKPPRTLVNDAHEAVALMIDARDTNPDENAVELLQEALASGRALEVFQSYSTLLRELDVVPGSASLGRLVLSARDAADVRTLGLENVWVSSPSSWSPGTLSAQTRSFFDPNMETDLAIAGDLDVALIAARKSVVRHVKAVERHERKRAKQDAKWEAKTLRKERKLRKRLERKGLDRSKSEPELLKTGDDEYLYTSQGDMLDPHGDGTLREGDPLFDLLMNNQTVMGERGEDGWSLKTNGGQQNTAA